MKTESNLLGGESPMYSFTSAKGKELHFTESRIVSEKSDSSRGRFIMFDKVSMVKKRRPRRGPSFHLEWMFLSFISIILGLLSLRLHLSGSTNTILLTAIPAVFTLAAGVFYYKAEESKEKSEEETKDKFFINVRTCEGGIGFTVDESEVNRVMNELQDQLGSEVPVKEE